MNFRLENCSLIEKQACEYNDVLQPVLTLDLIYLQRHSMPLTVLLS